MGQGLVSHKEDVVESSTSRPLHTVGTKLEAEAVNVGFLVIHPEWLLLLLPLNWHLVLFHVADAFVQVMYK